MGEQLISPVKKDAFGKKKFSGFLRTQQDSVTLLKQSSKALYFTTLLNAHKYLFLCVTLGAMPLRSRCLLCLLRIQWFQTSLMLDWNGGFFCSLLFRLKLTGWWSSNPSQECLLHHIIVSASHQSFWEGRKGAKKQESSDIWAVKI